MGKGLYVSLRCGKIKQSAETAMHNHNMRASQTKQESNVDYSRTRLNRLILGRGDTVKAVNERITEKVPRKVREDASRVLEFVISASPEYFYDFDKLNITREQWDSLTPTNDPKYHEKVRHVFQTLNQERLNQFTEQVKEFCRIEFGDNLINCVLHLDEKTPHFHIAVTPIMGTSLTAKKYFTPGRARVWQDRLGRMCEPLGLSRGQPSDKQHQTLQEHRFKKAEGRGYRKGYRKGQEVGKSQALADSNRFSNKVQNFFKAGKINEQKQKIEALTKEVGKLQNQLQEAREDRRRTISINQELRRQIKKCQPAPKPEPKPENTQPVEKAPQGEKYKPAHSLSEPVYTDSVAGAEMALNQALSNLRRVELLHGLNSPQAVMARVKVNRAIEALNRAKEAGAKPKPKI